MQATRLGLLSRLAVSTLLAPALALIAVSARADEASDPDSDVPSSTTPEAADLRRRAAQLRHAGRPREAIEFEERALALLEQTHGAESTKVAAALDVLGRAYRDVGEFERAEPRFERALAIRKAQLGATHPLVASTIFHFASMLRKKGDFTRSERLYLDAVAILEGQAKPDHKYLALALDGLGYLYIDRARHHGARADLERAEPVLERALRVQEKTHVGGELVLARILNNLGIVYQRLGKLDRAETDHLRSLAIRERELLPGDPTIAHSLATLGELRRRQHRYAEAEAVLTRAIAIREIAASVNPLELATVLSDLAMLHVEQGSVTRAVPLEERAEDLHERMVARTLLTGTEAQKRNFLERFAFYTERTFTLHAKYAAADPAAARLALTTGLRRKGRLVDAMSQGVSALRRRMSAEDGAQFERLGVARGELSALAFRDEDAKQDAAAPRALEAEIDRIEAALALRSAEFRLQTEPVTIAALQKALAKDTALVELFTFRAADAAVDAGGAPSVRRYVAYVLQHVGEPRFVDLGDAESIDALAGSLRKALADPGRRDARDLGRALDERVGRPIRGLLGPTRRIVISPDGGLGLVPFDAFVDENGRFLVETLAITYVSAGRDLLRFAVRVAPRDPPLVLADPDFGSLDDSRADSGAERAVGSLGRAVFTPLPGTAAEAARIGPLLPGATTATRTDASEARLKRVRAPSVLHVATHGFFLTAPDDVDRQNTRGLTLRVDGALGAPAPTAALPDNPLLRSGLGLAGANLRRSGDEDGVLTALEASGLDLWGTQLVVLSACETGVGEIQSGESVYGLRRAFVSRAPRRRSRASGRWTTTRRAI